ncbi:hypothetical protein [Streptomyces olindensis]|uniref:hypothetical protein n=1 Tax=Streptomyces olindensis TaxID=358823 RepID=UPI00340723D8
MKRPGRPTASRRTLLKAGAGAALTTAATTGATLDKPTKGHTVSGYHLSGVSLKKTFYKGRPAHVITMPSSEYQDPETEVLTDRDFMAWQELDFGDGTIDVDVAGVLAPDAPFYARGFIGVAFRIGTDPEMSFESIYLRPTNSRAEDQVRRNHSIQYWAYPDHPFGRLRQESPEKYESYVDIEPDAWTHMRIEVRGAQAKLFVNHADQPSLVVNDLKLGDRQRGGIGLWIESGTVGYFSRLRVREA